MSTTYAILRTEININDFDDGDYFIIGKTHGFTCDGEIIQKFLKDDTPIVALDNDTNIKNIKDLREYYGRKVYQYL